MSQSNCPEMLPDVSTLEPYHPTPADEEEYREYITGALDLRAEAHRLDCLASQAWREAETHVGLYGQGLCNGRYEAYLYAANTLRVLATLALSH